MTKKQKQTEDPHTLARREVDEQLPQARADLESMREFQILDEVDQNTAVECIQTIKVNLERLEERRRVITVPLNKALKEVNNLFRPVREALEEGEKILKLKLAGYQEARERENAQALLAAASATTVEDAAEALTELETVTTAKGSSVRYRWEAEVFHPELVPTEFLSPDLGKIEASMNASVKASGEPMPIPGVRFKKKPIVTIRRAG